jgi:hypothetical protein
VENYSTSYSRKFISFLKITFLDAKQIFMMEIKGTPNVNNNAKNKPFTYLLLILIAFFPSMLSMRSVIVLSSVLSTGFSGGGTHADFFMKNVIMSMGRGNTIVEFFSAEIVFKVFLMQNKAKELITTKATQQKVAFMNSPEGIEVEAPLANRQ